MVECCVHVQCLCVLLLMFHSLKPLSHLAALPLRLHDVLNFPEHRAIAWKMAISRRSHGVSNAISWRSWRFYGVPWCSTAFWLVIACALMAKSKLNL